MKKYKVNVLHVVFDNAYVQYKSKETSEISNEEELRYEIELRYEVSRKFTFLVP